jgi:hypothetical protein
MTIQQIKEAAKIAKSKTHDRRWLAAIDKAVAGVESGWWIITELQHCLVITTEGGKTYFANEKHCQCEAFFHGQACKHRALARLVEICETAPVQTSVPARPAAAPRQPRVTRSVERDHSGGRVKVVRCDGWAI